MAESEFILLELEYRTILCRLFELGSFIAYDFSETHGIQYLSLEDIDIAMQTDNASMTVKHRSFAVDDPKVIVFKKEGVTWHMFSDLDGDGHMRLSSRKFLAGGKVYFHVTFGYTSFFVGGDGTHRAPHPNLIAMYRSITSFAKKMCLNTTFKNSIRIYVSKAIISHDDGWLENIDSADVI